MPRIVRVMKKAKKKGVSPVIGAVLMFSILMSILALFIVWQANMEQMELQKQKEKMQQDAERRGESLIFFEYVPGLRLMGLYNNGGIQSEIVYTKTDNGYTGVTHLYDEGGTEKPSVIPPQNCAYVYVSDSQDWETLVVGTALGNQFIYNRPKAIIQKFEPAGEELMFYGDAACEGSTVTNWEWDFDYSGVFAADGHGQNVAQSLSEGSHQVALRVTDTTGNQDITVVTLEVSGVLAEVTPIVALENVGNTGSTYGSWWIFRFRKGCDQVSIPLKNISSDTIQLTDLKVFWHEMQQSDPCVSDLCPARLASIRVYRQYKPGGVWNGEWTLVKSTEPPTWNPDFDPDPSTPTEENFPGGISILGKYRFMDPEELWMQCFWGFYETQDCNCLDCQGSSPDYIGFNLSGELVSFVDPDDPNTPDYLDFEPDETIVVTLRFCAGNRCGDDLTLKLYDPDEVYTVTVHVPLDLQIGPRDGSIENDTSVTFRWRELFDYQAWLIFGSCVHRDNYHYWLQVSPDPEFPEGNRTDVVGGSQFDFSEVAVVKYSLNLSPDERYYWRVNGSKDSGATWSGWSRAWTFCTISCPAEASTSFRKISSPADYSLPLMFVVPLGMLMVTLRRKRRI
jgi:PKD repeat protein